MALTYQETKTVKATIPILQESGEELAATFYRTMIADHPELNNYFNTANQANGRQPRALTSVILHFAKNISDIGEIIPKLERVCQKHCSLGIRPEHYEIVGKYLLRAFGVILGPAVMTPLVHDAWTKAYWTLARMLIGREVQLYKDFDSWTGYRKFSVSRKVQESEDIWSFYLTPADKKALPSFLPGQYVSVQVHVPSLGYLQSRQFALSDAPRPDCYRITVKRDQGAKFANSVSAAYFNPGLVSNYLIDRASPDDALDVSHPAGEFYLDTHQNSSVPLVLISAGVGAAPLMSILNTVADTQPLRDVSWIYGSRKGIPFEHHVELLKHRVPGLRSNIFRTDLAAATLAGVERREYDFRVDLAQVDRGELFLGHGGTEYFICGPEQFMMEVNDYLLAEGVQPVRIKVQLLSTGDLAFKK
ncbi:globin-like protein [Coniochaeta sp. 2T2.1]|nr:globin-like protein [Coniochaeta sp. 2T2.1]